MAEDTGAPRIAPSDEEDLALSDQYTSQVAQARGDLRHILHDLRETGLSHRALVLTVLKEERARRQAAAQSGDEVDRPPPQTGEGERGEAAETGLTKKTREKLQLMETELHLLHRVLSHFEDHLGEMKNVISASVLVKAGAKSSSEEEQPGGGEGQRTTAPALLNERFADLLEIVSAMEMEIDDFRVAEVETRYAFVDELHELDLYVEEAGEDIQIGQLGKLSALGTEDEGGEVVPLDEQTAEDTARTRAAAEKQASRLSLQDSAVTMFHSLQAKHQFQRLSGDNFSADFAPRSAQLQEALLSLARELHRDAETRLALEVLRDQGGEMLRESVKLGGSRGALENPKNEKRSATVQKALEICRVRSSGSAALLSALEVVRDVLLRPIVLPPTALSTGLVLTEQSLEAAKNALAGQSGGQRAGEGVAGAPGGAGGVDVPGGGGGTALATAGGIFGHSLLAVSSIDWGENLSAPEGGRNIALSKDLGRHVTGPIGDNPPHELNLAAQQRFRLETLLDPLVRLDKALAFPAALDRNVQLVEKADGSGAVLVPTAILQKEFLVNPGQSSVFLANDATHFFTNNSAPYAAHLNRVFRIALCQTLKFLEKFFRVSCCHGYYFLSEFKPVGVVDDAELIQSEAEIVKGLNAVRRLLQLGDVEDEERRALLGKKDRWGPIWTEKFNIRILPRLLTMSMACFARYRSFLPSRIH